MIDVEGTSLTSIEATAARIGRPDARAMEAGRVRLDSLTKPPGSLGRLEELLVRMAGITGDPLPVGSPACVLVMAGDHGIVAEGVSAYPAEVTLQMVANFVAGGAAINVLARQAGAAVRVVDVGVAADVDHPDLLVRKVRYGTANMTRGPAMTREEARRAVEVGIAVADDETRCGARVIALGEMGIGNSAASSALLAALAGLPPESVVGPGTGLDPAGVQRKIAAIRRALEVNQPNPDDPLDALAKVGGLEIGALAGAMLACAARRVPAVIDGFICGAAAVLAARIAPGAADFMIAAHRSAEPGHRLALELLGLRPLLEWDLRLGEGTGAALALPALAAAAAVAREMATFEQAGVSGRVEDDGTRRTGSDGAGAAAEPAAPVVADGAAGGAANAADLDSTTFSADERAGVYKAIRLRRDIRHFRTDPLPPGMLERLLGAAHHAPSVGFMQPWNFIVIRSAGTKQRLWEVIERERRAAVLHFEGARAELFSRLKVEGIQEAPVTLCVTCDPTRHGPHVLGRNSIPATDVYSVACAIQNLSLAARAEGLGTGWVTFFKPGDVRAVLDIPPHIEPVALVSIGYPHEFPDRPLLESVGWQSRLPLRDLVYLENWGGS